MPATDAPTVRWVLRKDIPDLACIAAVSFPAPWGEDAFLARLRGPQTTGLAAVVNDEVAGYVVFDWRPDHLFVVQLAVRPDLRRRGVGTALLDAVRGKLGDRTWFDAIAPEDNLVAHQFLRADGFKAVHVLRGWFDGMDGYQMEWRVSG